MTDVFVAGGGPGGLAAAIAARRKGFRVVVADPARPPIDKGCGEGLMHDCVRALARLGVAIGPGESHPLRGIRFVEAGIEAEARFAGGEGLGARRTALHCALVQAAEAAGVELRWGTRVAGIATVRSRWIVGADGGRSQVRRWAGLEGGQATVRYGFRRHYAVAPWSDCTEIHWARGFQVYVTPVAPELVSVTVLTADSATRLDQALAALPGLARRLQRPVTAECGAVTASRRLPAVWRGNVALVGDASGSVDAITGEGITLAVRQGLALADALEAGDLTRYEREHRRIRRRPALMASLLMALGERDGLRPRVLCALRASPGLFGRLLAFHIDGGRI